MGSNAASRVLDASTSKTVDTDFLVLNQEDGSTICYELIGSGKIKVIFFHGFPAGRRQGRLLKRYCREFDLQVLTFDRPGYGHSKIASGKRAASKSSAKSLSSHVAQISLDQSSMAATRQSKRGFSKIVSSVENLADSVGWESFHLISVSGGTPYALAVAAASKRVLSLTTICGLAPLGEPSFREIFSSKYLQVMNAVDRTPAVALDALLSAARRGAPPANFAGYPVGALAERFSNHDAVRNGVAGIKLDLANYLHARDIDWARIKCPTTIWHGTRDSVVPYQFAKMLKERIPHAEVELRVGESHYSLAQNHAPALLKKLVSF